MSNDEHRLRPNDPYNSMLEGARNDRRPEFLNQSKNDGEGKKSAERKKSKDGLKAAENIASTAVGAGMGGGGATEAVKPLGNLFKGKGKFGGDGGAGKKKKGKASKFSFGFVVIILVMIVPMLLSVSNIPMILIGTMDMNLQDLGFTQGNAIMEAQAGHITQNALLKGEVSQAHAAALARQGIDVGQINLAGEFVKTNVYLANLDEDDMEVASLEDGYSLHHDEGELVVRFRDRIIEGSDFLATIESDPEFCMAYFDALSIKARFYFNSEVEEVFQEMGISRDATANWQRTGDREQDWENFQDMMSEALDKNSAVSVNGYDGSRVSDGDGDTETNDENDGAEDEGNDTNDEDGEENDDNNENVDEEDGSKTEDEKTDEKETEGKETGSRDVGIRFAIFDSKKPAMTLAKRGDSDTEIVCTNGEVKEGEGGFTVDVKCDASTVVSQVGDYTKGERATEKGAQLLGAAIAATQPIQAANGYAFIEEILQRTRIYGGNNSDNSVAIFAAAAGGYGGGFTSGAPIDELMRLLDEQGTITYKDVTTHEEITATESMFENKNFVAAISKGIYDEGQAQNFQSDSALVATSMMDSEVINGTTMATNGQRKSNIVLRTGGEGSVDMDRLSLATDSVAMTFSDLPSEVLTSRIGGDRTPGGGATLFNNIAQATLGYAPSDASAIMAYNKEANRQIALRAAAERATMNPFDITSRNTFLGSIVYNLGATILANYHNLSGGFSSTSIFGVVSSITDGATKGFLDTVVADGPGNEYIDILGKGCPTVNSIGVEGFMMCTAHGTVSTSYMDYTEEDWNSVLTEDDKKMYELLLRDRKSTVGVKDAEVCERYKSEFSSTGERITQSISDFFSKMVGLYESCSGVDDWISLGGAFSDSEANSENREKIRMLSAYSLFDTVNGLVNEAQSEMSKIKEEYYAKHPLDQSPAGRLARISGLTKSEAEIALNYADYLTMIANYQPNTRYAFGKSSVLIPETVEFVEDSEVKSSTYLAWFSKIEYSDVRNRSLVV